MYKLSPIVLLALLAGCVGHPNLQQPAGGEARLGMPRTVVLLHGYGRRPGSLDALADRLLASGYGVCKIGYSSILDAPAEILEGLVEDIAHCGPADGRLDFVTHSFGGILVRAYAREVPPERIGRVVMLAPPNHGSELSDLIGSSRLLGLFAGPVVAELGTGPGSLPNRLGPADFDVGVIAGSKSIHPIGSFVIDGPNDGTVTVASARLAGMRDFAVTPRAHSFIMNAPEVLAEVEAFLEDGCFSRRFDEVAYDDGGECAR